MTGVMALPAEALHTLSDIFPRVEMLARSVPGVSGIHELRAEYIGPETVRAGMHIEVQLGLPIEEADRIAEEVRQRMHRDTGYRYCVIYVDPATPEDTGPEEKTTTDPKEARPRGTHG